MRRMIVALVVFGLAGCAMQPMSPEQRAAYFQGLQRIQEQQAQQNQNLYNQEMANIRAAQAANAAQRSTNCITTYAGNQAYTNCQ